MSRARSTVGRCTGVVSRNKRSDIDVKTKDGCAVPTPGVPVRGLVVPGNALQRDLQTPGGQSGGTLVGMSNKAGFPSWSHQMFQQML